MQLHAYLETLTKKFNKYQTEVQFLSESSKEFIERKTKIVNEYVEKKSDSEYGKKRERYNQLTTRLKYIEDIVKEYEALTLNS